MYPYQIAVALRGDRGLEQISRLRSMWNCQHCGRSSGRSRIGTKYIDRPYQHPSNCGRSSGRSRIGTGIQYEEHRIWEIAVALRGDRGLELKMLKIATPQTINCGRSSGRSRIGTLGQKLDLSQIHIAVALRGDRGLELHAEKERLGAYGIAVALRGDRGLEQL